VLFVVKKFSSLLDFLQDVLEVGQAEAAGAVPPAAANHSFVMMTCASSPHVWRK